MSIWSRIWSGVRRTLSRLASYDAAIGTAATDEPQPSTLSAKHRAVVDAAWKAVMSTLTLPASGAPLGFCSATRSWWGKSTDRCRLSAGHSGPHVINDPLLIDVRPTEHFLDHGIVHRVEWFNFIHGERRREIWTVCGLIFETHNRTPRRKVVTCVRCMSR